MNTLELILAIIIANLVICIIWTQIRLNRALKELNEFYLSDEEAEKIWKEIETSQRIEEVEILPINKEELKSVIFELHDLFNTYEQNDPNFLFDCWWDIKVKQKKRRNNT